MKTAEERWYPVPRRGMEQVGVTLDRMVKRLGLSRGVRERMALVIWGQVVGGWAARNTRPVLVRRGELLVRVSTSTWAQELSLMRPQLIAKLNAQLGDEVVRDIRFAVDPTLGAAAGDGMRKGEAAPAPAWEPAVLAAGAGAGPQAEAGAQDAAGSAWEEEARDLELALGSGARAAWCRARASAVRRRQELLARGWKRCCLCGSWGDPGRAPAGEGGDLPFLCSTCLGGGAAVRISEAARVLRADPSASERDLGEKIPGLRGAEVRLARHIAAEAIRRQLRECAAGLLEGGREADWTAWRARAQELVLVATGLPIASIGEDDMCGALGDLLPLWRASRGAGRMPRDGKT